MGAGKTTVGALLSAHLDARLLDIDQLIEESQQASIPEMFSSGGEAAFRRLESEMLERVLGIGEPAIVACGGGIVLDSRNVELLVEETFVIYLKVTAQAVATRIEDFSTRPLLGGKDQRDNIAILMAQRKDIYERVADVTIDTDGKDPEEVCELIVRKLEEGDHGVLHP
jgi:shikimate kinase